MGRSSRWREWLLLSCSVLLALLIAEGVLRLHSVFSDGGTLEDLGGMADLPAQGKHVSLGNMLTVSPYRGVIYQLKPGLSEVNFKGVPVSTNRSGWREEELPRKKAKGTLRVLGLGDSVMFGWGVEIAERYFDVLEGVLNARYPEVRWESVALAVPGYNLAMEVEVLRRYGLAYEPDIIVYGYVPNDLCLPNFVVPRKGLLARESFLLSSLLPSAQESTMVVRTDALLEGKNRTGAEGGGR